MADPTAPPGNSNGNGSSNGSDMAGNRQFALHRIYVKDISLESPNAPAIFIEKMGEPEIKLNLRTSHSNINQGLVEVVLHISVQAVVGERTIFLIELEQAGMFQISGFPESETRAIIGIACANALFPYAREAVSDLVQRGGLPPLVLQPIDFATLFNQQQAGGAAAANA